jgi:outer membrane receptor protein involved in Fe transport
MLPPVVLERGIMLSALLLTLVLGASAQEEEPKKEQEAAKELAPPKEETDPLTYQEVVVVTATRTEEELLDSVANVSAFTAEEITRSPAFVIDDQLRRVPGFSLFRRSSSLYSHPTAQGVSLRGIGPSGASRSLVLWNGIPLNDPYGNWIYFNRLPQLSLGQAEIARGATSQLYGSSALGGTIQLIPRGVEEKTFDFRAQGGSLDTYDVDVFASDRAGDWGWILSGRAFDTGGYVQIPEDQRGEVDVPVASEFQTFLGRLEYRDFHFDVNLYNEKRSNGTEIQQNDSQIYLFETGYDTERWSANFYGQSQEFDSGFSRILPGRTGEVLTQEQHVPSVGFGSSFLYRTARGLQLGADWRYVGAEDQGVTGIEQHHQNFAGGFLQYLFTFDQKWDVLLGGRFDVWQNRETQATFNPRAGLVYRASDEVTVRASGYTGFRAPSLNELYRPFRLGNVLTQPNPDLTEERLWGIEGGVDIHPYRSLLVRLNGFYNSFEDPIANVTVSSTPALITRQRQNIGSATIQGFEAEAIYRLGSGWSARGAYLFSDAVVDQTGLDIPQSPKNQGTVGVGYDGRIQLVVDIRLVGDAYDDDLNQLLLPAFNLLDLSLRVPLTSSVAAYFAVENVADEEYVVRLTPIENLGAPRVAHGGIEVRLFR